MFKKVPRLVSRFNILMESARIFSDHCFDPVVVLVAKRAEGYLPIAVVLPPVRPAMPQGYASQPIFEGLAGIVLRQRPVRFDKDFMRQIGHQVRRQEARDDFTNIATIPVEQDCKVIHPAIQYSRNDDGIRCLI